MADAASRAPRGGPGVCAGGRSGSAAPLPIGFQPMMRALVRLAAAAALLVSGDALAQALPRPSGLEPNVRFWTRIYTEVDTHGGLIHDSERLDIVYETLRFP